MFPSARSNNRFMFDYDRERYLHQLRLTGIDDEKSSKKRSDSFQTIFDVNFSQVRRYGDRCRGHFCAADKSRVKDGYIEGR